MRALLTSSRPEKAGVPLFPRQRAIVERRAYTFHIPQRIVTKLTLTRIRISAVV